jgi:hypothetical protein
MQNHLKDELHNIISGKSQVRYGAIIQTITSYLENGENSSTEIEVTKQVREEETKRLEAFFRRSA